MPLPSGLRALGHQAYRRFFFGQVISQSGSWMQAIGQSWLVLQLTDRLSRRRVVLVTQTAQAVLAVYLAALAWPPGAG